MVKIAFTSQHIDSTQSEPVREFASEAELLMYVAQQSDKPLTSMARLIVALAVEQVENSVGVTFNEVVHQQLDALRREVLAIAAQRIEETP